MINEGKRYHGRITKGDGYKIKIKYVFIITINLEII
jgi:hypothetical protein